MFAFVAAATTESGGFVAGLTHSAGNAFNYIASGVWAVPSWDLLIVVLFVAAVFLYGMSLGRDRIVAILVSIYLSFAVAANLPAALPGDPSVVRVVTFLGLFLLLFLLLSRSALMGVFGGLAGSWFQVFLFSVFHVGLLVSVTMSFLPPDALTHLAPLTREVFASEWGRFIWITAPVVSLAFLRG